MIAVLFEAAPTEDGRGRYLELAAALGPQLAQIEGFISIERFQSLSDPQRLLSLSYWADEQAAQRWRRWSAHRQAQAEGRDGVFVHYRIRVAAVLRDYGRDERKQAPIDP